MCVLFLRRIGANGVNGMMFQSCDLRKFIVYRPASDTRADGSLASRSLQLDGHFRHITFGLNMFFVFVLILVFILCLLLLFVMLVVIVVFAVNLLRIVVVIFVEINLDHQGGGGSSRFLDRSVTLDHLEGDEGARLIVQLEQVLVDARQQARVIKGSCGRAEFEADAAIKRLMQIVEIATEGVPVHLFLLQDMKRLVCGTLLSIVGGGRIAVECAGEDAIQLELRRRRAIFRKPG
jgi:hypothetical protein